MRLEQDPDEQRQLEEALARQATPTHEQPTEEFDAADVLKGLTYHIGQGELPESITSET
jgi:hypothetical protein